MAHTHKRISPSPTSQHNLLNIPPEITEKIAEYADPKDLLALRLVNREVSARVLRTFAKVHFSEVAFLLGSPDSMKALLKISETPGLAKHVKKITLCGDGLCESEPFLQIPTERTDPVELRKRRAVRESQKSLIDTDQDLHWLNTALCRLRRTGLCPSIVLTMSFGVTRCVGREQLPRQATGSPTFAHASRYGRVVLDALSLSDLQAQALNLGSDFYPFPLYDLAREPTRFAQITATFAKLRRLGIWVQSHEAGEPISNDHLGLFATCLGRAMHLEHLELGWDYSTAKGELSQPFLGLSFPALKTLRLNLWSLPYAATCTFMRRQPSPPQGDYLGLQIHRHRAGQRLGKGKEFRRAAGEANGV